MAAAAAPDCVWGGQERPPHPPATHRHQHNSLSGLTTNQQHLHHDECNVLPSGQSSLKYVYIFHVIFPRQEGTSHTHILPHVSVVASITYKKKNNNSMKYWVIWVHVGKLQWVGVRAAGCEYYQWATLSESSLSGGRRRPEKILSRRQCFFQTDWTNVCSRAMKVNPAITAYISSKGLPVVPWLKRLPGN